MGVYCFHEINENSGGFTMGLFDGLKKSVADAKADLEAKTKEIQEKLNPLNAVKGTFKNPFAKADADDEEQQPVADDEEQQPAAGSETSDTDGNANNVYNDEELMRHLRHVKEVIERQGDTQLTLQDIIAYVRRGTPFESKSSEGDFRKVMENISMQCPLKYINGHWYNKENNYDPSTHPNVSLEDAVAYIKENYDESLEKYYQRHPSKRPASAQPAKPAREPSADKMFDYPKILNALTGIKAELDKSAPNLTKDDIIAAFRRGTPDEGKGTGDFKKAMMNPGCNTTIADIKKICNTAVNKRRHHAWRCYCIH